MKEEQIKKCIKLSSELDELKMIHKNDEKYESGFTIGWYFDDFTSVNYFTTHSTDIVIGIKNNCHKLFLKQLETAIENIEQELKEL